MSGPVLGTQGVRPPGQSRHQLRWHGVRQGDGIAASPNVSFNQTNLVSHELSITGSPLGNHATIREMLLFAHGRGVNPRIEQLPMRQVNEVIRRLKEHGVRYRIVLNSE